MPLINCKIHLELNWGKDCVMSTVADTTFDIKKQKTLHPNCYYIKQRKCKTGQY